MLRCCVLRSVPLLYWLIATVPPPDCRFQLQHPYHSQGCVASLAICMHVKTTHTHMQLVAYKVNPQPTDTFMSTLVHLSVSVSHTVSSPSFTNGGAESCGCSSGEANCGNVQFVVTLIHGAGLEFTQRQQYSHSSVAKCSLKC